MSEREREEVLLQEQQLHQTRELRASQTSQDSLQRRRAHNIATRQRRAYQAAEYDLDIEEMEGELEI